MRRILQLTILLAAFAAVLPVVPPVLAQDRLKAQPITAHIPVVMVTSLNDQSERVRGLDAGADDFLVKPIKAKRDEAVV